MIRFSIIALIYVAISFIAQIFFHEAGHFVFGRLTGYRFLSFRVFGIVILQDEKTLSIKRCRGAGSFGQCLMLPPQKENYPFILNTLGGCVMNALIAVASVIIMCFYRQIPLVHILGLSLSALYGFSFAIMNVIPMKRTGVVNDGQVLLDLLKNSYARECYRKQLIMLPKLIEGKTYGEFSCDLFKVAPGADLTNSLIGYHKIIECYHFMELRDWSRAQGCLESFYEVLEELPKMLHDIVLAEDLYIRIRLGDSTVKESGIYENIKKYFKRGTGDYHTVRVRIAYEMYSRPGTIDRKEILKELHKLSRQYVYRGEASFCDSLIRDFL